MKDRRKEIETSLGVGDERGVSIAELVVVMAIVLILAMIGLPQLTKARAVQEVKGVARTIASALSYAKVSSFKYTGGVSVDFIGNKVILCRGDSGTCSEDEQHKDDILTTYRLPDQIILEENSLDGIYFKNGLPYRSTGAFGATSVCIRHTKADKALKVVISKPGRVKIEDCS